MNPRSPVNFPTLVLGFLYGISGVIALVYEVLWQRQFALIFGSSAAATAAVLAAYFLGLALGSYIVGRMAKRWTRLVRVYAVLEVFIAIGALAVSPMLNLFDHIQPRLGASGSALLIFKTAWAFGSILAPTFCMGGTLPVLGALIDGDRRSLGINAGFLYVVNTVGAALGALAVPFLLLRIFGAAGSVWICAGVNLFLAACAWKLQAGWPAAGRIDFPKSVLPGSILALSFLSGMFTFALQVLWNRAFAQVHENSMFSFAAIVSLFIVALAIGAELARQILRGKTASLSLLGWSWLAGGVAVSATPGVFLRKTHGLNYVFSAGGETAGVVKLVGLAAVVVLLPALFLGAGFPALMQEAGRRAQSRVSEILGALVTANMLGSITGALVGGFLIPHWFGLWRGILLMGLMLVALGALHVFSSFPRFGLCLTVGAAFILGCWGISKTDLIRVRIEPGERLAALTEGAHGIVAVVRRPDSLRLKLNNYYVLGGTLSAGDERMQAHLPLLLHPSPKRAAFLGLGTAISAGASLLHPVQNVTAIELVPEVIDAARRFFGEANRNILDDLKTTVVTDDARNFLRTTSAKFDVIIGDLVVPWRQGEGALLTLENFSAARAALAPGGIYCQWLPTFQLSETELDIIMRTFCREFPNASVWRGDFSPDRQSIALIGAIDPNTLEGTALSLRLREMQKDPLNPQLSDPVGVWMNFVGAIEARNFDGTDLRINSEDRPWIELLGGTKNRELCTGRTLQSVLNSISRRSPSQAPPQLQGSKAGALLYEYTLSISEGNGASAAAAQAELKSILPQNVFSAVFAQ